MAGSKEATDRPSYHAVGKEDIVAVDRKTFRSDVWEHFGWHRKAIGSSWVVCNMKSTSLMLPNWQGSTYQFQPPLHLQNGFSPQPKIYSRRNDGGFCQNDWGNAYS